ncbi:MAG: tRNA pseudouridine(38-40) synthase TruA, partial [Actinobacteria bacterium]|nr:tRNA pseudouridine(38-40) synthase TruA [Actinomycetota bacterium]
MTLFDTQDAQPPPAPTLRVRATVAYLGGAFSGFAAQAQPGVRTVAGAITAAAGRVLGYPIELGIAGRTDKGVHARGQVISFDVREGTDLDSLSRSLNKLLGPDIVIRELVPAADGFDARFSATSRLYR